MTMDALGCCEMAFNSDGSVVPGASVSGLPASSYFFYLKDREGIVPDIWYWEGNAESAKVSGVKMKRFPPVFTMDIVAEPEDFVSATATIDNIVTRFSINGVISVSANPNIVSRSFTLSGSEQHLTSFIMPMAGEGSWMLPISILMDGMEPQTLNLAVSERIKSGDEVSLSLDFTDYQEKGKAVCRLAVKNEEGNKTWVKSITHMAAVRRWGFRVAEGTMPRRAISALMSSSSPSGAFTSSVSMRCRILSVHCSFILSML